MVEGLARFHDPRSYVVGGLCPLAESPKANRSGGWTQTNTIQKLVCEVEGYQLHIVGLTSTQCWFWNQTPL